MTTTLLSLGESVLHTVFKYVEDDTRSLLKLAQTNRSMYIALRNYTSEDPLGEIITTSNVDSVVAWAKPANFAYKLDDDWFYPLQESKAPNATNVPVYIDLQNRDDPLKELLGELQDLQEEGFELPESIDIAANAGEYMESGIIWLFTGQEYGYDAESQPSLDILKQIPNLCSVEMDYGRYRTDASAFAGIPKVSLKYWKSLVDVRSLATCSDVDLSGCTSVSDVSCLKKLKRLVLSECEQVTDVSSLGNLEYLDIEFTSVQDFSALKNVRELVLGGGNVQSLTTLNGYQGKVTLRQVCDVDVSPLAQCHTVILEDCENIANVEILQSSVKHIEIW